MAIWIPSGAVFGDSVQHRQQLAHASHQGDLLALACGQQMLVVSDRPVRPELVEGRLTRSALASTPQPERLRKTCLRHVPSQVRTLEAQVNIAFCAIKNIANGGSGFALVPAAGAADQV